MEVHVIYSIAWRCWSWDYMAHAIVWFRLLCTMFLMVYVWIMLFVWIISLFTTYYYGCHCMVISLLIIMDMWLYEWYYCVSYVVVWLCYWTDYLIARIMSCRIYCYLDNCMINIEYVISIVRYDILLMYICTWNYVHILDIHIYLYHELLLQISWNLCNWLNIALFDLCV